MSRVDILITAAELRGILAARTPVSVLDVRWQLAQPDGRDDYAAGHVPGAVYVSLDDDLTDHALSDRGRHPLPSGAAVQEAARRWGVRAGVPVVVYDDWNRAGSGRAWWVLTAAGIPGVRILDGGLAAWAAAGGELETGSRTAEPGDITVTYDDLYRGGLPTLTADEASALGTRLVDARAPERFRGETEPVDPVAGHVPGAVNVPSTALLGSDGTFAAVPDLDVAGAYCGSGVTASVVVAAFAAAGTSVALFPGSWSQWCAEPGRPVAKGGLEGPDFHHLMETVIVIGMPLAFRRAATALLASPLLLAGCAGGADETSAPPTDAPPCPTSPVEVVVSVDQWGDIVSELGGACANVTTLLASSSVDPHDYEPSPADAAKFQGAQLVVVNGGHYDEWAAKLAAGSAPNAPIVDAVSLGGGDDHADHADHADDDHGAEGHEGHDHGEGNPHVWYRPATVTAVADAVTAKLTELSPSAGDYFAERRTAFGNDLKPYEDLIAKIKAAATGKTYAATESVFDNMADALGLQNKTPPGYQAASQAESDPAPGDLDAFFGLLEDKGVDVLIFNSQTEGSVPNQIHGAAELAGIPIVQVTETVAPGAESFEAWQVDQLTSLAKALGVQA